MSAVRRQRGRWWWLLVVAFVSVPLVEIWTILQAGRLVGPWWTIALLVASGVVGGWLVRREGGRAWRALRETLGRGRMPAQELADGALVLVGGTLMLTPGFLSDVVGILMILPATRPVARRLLTRTLERRLVGAVNVRRPGPPAGGPVVRGDVVDQ
jgi:UPF0716 protein FxsA